MPSGTFLMIGTNICMKVYEVYVRVVPEIMIIMELWTYARKYCNMWYMMTSSIYRLTPE